MRKRGKKSLAESAADLAESVVPAIESAVETVTDRAAPIVAEGKQLAAEGRKLAREKVDLGLEKAGHGREVATQQARRGRRRAAAKAAAFSAADPADKLSALKHAEPAPEKMGRLKKVLLLGGLVALGAVIAKKLTGGGAQDNWQSSYTPSPAPRQAAAAPDDQAAASPGEALADQAAEPHPDTTPEEPAEVVELAEFADASQTEKDEPQG